jgi:hypothetical protein
MTAFIRHLKSTRKTFYTISIGVAVFILLIFYLPVVPSGSLTVKMHIMRAAIALIGGLSTAFMTTLSGFQEAKKARKFFSRVEFQMVRITNMRVVDECDGWWNPLAMFGIFKGEPVKFVMRFAKRATYLEVHRESINKDSVFFGKVREIKLDRSLNMDLDHLIEALVNSQRTQETIA